MNVVPKELWRPTPDQIEQSNLKAFMRWLEVAKGLIFRDYQSLWAWSVARTAGFLGGIMGLFPHSGHKPYDTVWDAEKMPGTKWFSGSTLNYAEHIFKGAVPHQPAILFQSERSPLQEISWHALENEVGALQAFLREAGIEKGDRVVGFLPNIPQATTALLAATGMGCVWSSCSPDFGVDSVVERFAQIEPKVFIAVDGYAYGGKSFDKRAVVEAIVKAIPGLEVVISHSLP
jgi:acetoacetyl-CoA synthetase